MKILIFRLAHWKNNLFKKVNSLKKKKIKTEKNNKKLSRMDLEKKLKN